jgi:hypothetical protein
VSNAPRPDFFVVGAPKCGTTSLDRSLRQHPDIFMPDRKDLPHFGSDLEFTFTYQYGERRETLKEYLRFFEAAGEFARVGETSCWYLFSRRAAAEIRAFAPDAIIIIMLRNPVDMMYSQHSQFLSNLNEDISSFEDALEAEPDRRQAQRIPGTAHFPRGLQYRETARYADQVERYLDTFGPDRVHVIIYDDYRADAAGEVHRVLTFLGLDQVLPLATEIANPNKVVKHPRLHALAMARPTRLEDLYHAVTPARFHGRLAAAARARSLQYAARPPLSTETRSALQQEFADDVTRLGTLIDRDLSSWLAQATEIPESSQAPSA